MELSEVGEGIVDDNVEVLRFLDDYEGDVFLYSHDSHDGEGVACVDWAAVYEEVVKRFG